MSNVKKILTSSGKYIIMIFAVALGITFDVDAAGSFEAFVSQVGLSDGAMVGAILYLVWENKKKLEKIIHDMDEVKQDNREIKSDIKKWNKNTGD